MYVSYKEDILRLREQGKSYNEIAEELGCAKSTISYYCSPNTRKNSRKIQRTARNSKKNSKHQGSCQECGKQISIQRRYCSSECRETNTYKRSLNVRSTGNLKTCSICRKTKDLSRFGFNRNTKDGYMRQCSSCNSSRVKEYIKKADWKGRKAYLEHGLSESQYFSMLEKQKYSCKVCSNEFSDKLLPVVDHDHLCCSGSWSCGKCVRGILCNGCNSALGFIRDSIDTAENLVVYLKTHQVNELSRC